VQKNQLLMGRILFFKLLLLLSLWRCRRCRAALLSVCVCSFQGKPNPRTFYGRGSKKTHSVSRNFSKLKIPLWKNVATMLIKPDYRRRHLQQVHLNLGVLFRNKAIPIATETYFDRINKTNDTKWVLWEEYCEARSWDFGFQINGQIYGQDWFGQIMVPYLHIKLKFKTVPESITFQRHKIHWFRKIKSHLKKIILEIKLLWILAVYFVRP